jgi:peptidoglycan/LPS O-acetylase OafA/YrhL
MVNRFARIYPMYFILTLATFIVMLILKKGESNLTILFLNLSFLNGFFDGTKFYEILQGWTLTVEEMFYLLAPLFFLLIKRAKFYLAILPFGFLLAGIVLAKVFSKIDLDGFLSSSEFMLQRTFFGRCFEFFIGIGLAIVYKKRISVMQNYHFTYAGMTMIIACLFVMTVLRGSHEYGIQHPLGKVINSLVLPLAGISLFFYGLLTEQTFISKILGGKFFVLIGKSSYVFYLIHIGIIASFIQKIIPNAIVIFFAINLISILLYKYVEEPLSRIVRTRLGSQSLKL